MILLAEPGTPDAIIMDQVRHTMTLGLPEINPAPSDKGRIHLYANGPSARLHPPQYPCMALNGALKLFDVPRVTPPTFWCACDPGPVVADFLTTGYLPTETRYLVASKCNPAVFEALVGRAAILWHSADASSRMLTGKRLVRGGVSVTIDALFLLDWIGYSEIIVHGWDGCYGPAGESHATPQGHDRSNDITVRIGCAEHEFSTTPTWFLELSDAREALQLISAKVNVLSNGMMACGLADLLQSVL